MHVHTGIHVKILRHYCIEACPLLDDSWKVVKIEGDEITYKKGRESITFRTNKRHDFDRS